MAPSKSLDSNKQLPENFNRHLSAYCVAAATAGVGMLALVQPSEAKVVITNKTIPIQGNLSLDLNNDGVPDFDFSFFKTQAHYFQEAALGVFPSQRGGAIVARQGYASALLRSAKIGPSDHFSGGVYKSSLVGVGIEGNVCSYSKCKSGGNWGGNHPNRFLGVRFAINGAIHFGWVRITVTITATDILEATITEYGYETIPRKRVLAGVPSSNVARAESAPIHERIGAPSLGMLASGVDGLSIWRREDDNELR
jgi:hypothetical protein